MEKVLILIFSITLASCGETDTKQNQRTTYWQKQITAIESSNLEMKDLLKQYAGYRPKHDLSSNTITFTEDIELNSLICKSWHYMITVKGNDLGKVEKATMSEAGICL